MSGAMQYRVNRFRDSTVLPNRTHYRFFWEWLQYINSHPNLSVVEAGTGTTSHGAAIPAQWLSWDGIVDPSTLTPALDSNSWVVFRADNADPLLNGGGTMQWEAKIQVSATAYSDPSGTDYGKNGQINIVVLRSCPAGGWTGTPTWDFAPIGGEESSLDQAIYQGQNLDYYLDIVGDDDTLFWRGAAGEFPTDDPPSRSKGGYLGMTQRRSADITWPFFMMCGRISDTGSGTGENAGNSRRDTNNYYAWARNYTLGDNMWPTYSVGRDGIRVTAHKIESWHRTISAYMSPFHYTGEDVLAQFMYCERQGLDRYDVLGELRFVMATDFSKAHSLVFGDSLDLIQFAFDSASYGGLVMPWKPGEVPIW